MIKTRNYLFNSRSPSVYFFIFGFILKILTCDIAQAMDYVLCQLFKQYKSNNDDDNQYRYIGNKFVNHTEIEFILYYILRIIEWYNKHIKPSIHNTDKMINCKIN